MRTSEEGAHQIDVQIEEQVDPVRYGTRWDIVERVVRTAVLTTLAYVGVNAPCEVVVVLSDDDALHALNRRFRGVDRPTDVLAFADDTRGPYVGSGPFPRYLGDVVISIDRAAEQAAEVGGTLTQELQLLTVHGVLHLLGFDHAEPADKARMWAVQSAVLKALHADIPLPE